jgi:hypothetical protein
MPSVLITLTVGAQQVVITNPPIALPVVRVTLTPILLFLITRLLLGLVHHLLVPILGVLPLVTMSPSTAHNVAHLIPPLQPMTPPCVLVWQVNTQCNAELRQLDRMLRLLSMTLDVVT